jgi:DivIVA domain-containing protein
LTGDDVREIVLPRSHSGGYNRTDVDDLLGRVADELDAGHAAAPQIRTASFRSNSVVKGYDVHAVDWVLSELLRAEEKPERAGTADAWRDLPVVNVVSRGRDVIGQHHADLPARGSPARLDSGRRMLKQQCVSAWRGFDRVPGVHLVCRRRHVSGADLYAAGQQPLASVWGFKHMKISIGRRTVTFMPARKERQLLPVTEEIARHEHRDRHGHFCANPPKLSDRRSSLVSGVQVALDETGAPVLYVSGKHLSRSSHSRISFGPERWLRFPVRGTSESDAIMTAVDEAGRKVARYRCISRDTEIIVHPGRQLTGELIVAIAASASWVHSFFQYPG